MNAPIRAATVADLDPLLDLVHGAYRGDAARRGWTHEADLLDGQRTDAAALTEIIQDEGQRLLITGPAERLIGCVQVSDEGRGKAYLGMLSVDPEHQAGGLGRWLIAAAEDCAREVFGARCMEMTVIRQRIELIAYYERRGYLQTGETRPFPSDDPRFGLPTRPDLGFVVLAKRLRAGRSPAVAPISRRT